LAQHLALLGDSIFDNAPYVDSGEGVGDHIKPLLTGWDVSLMAVDGDTTQDVHQKFARTPKKCRHLALSIGGNDALQSVTLLKAACSNILAALDILAQIQNDFRVAYRGVLDEFLSLQRPLIVCTIYEQVPGLGNNLKTALSLFNEVILSEASRAQLTILDLKHLCRDPADYSAISPIEPSSIGGERLQLHSPEF
jgi:GDSL-like Lipase/Acylhydrolase family